MAEARVRTMIFTATSDGYLDIDGRRVRCALGRSGVRPAADKREGDGASPLGVWPIRRVLYRPDRERDRVGQVRPGYNPRDRDRPGYQQPRPGSRPDGYVRPSRPSVGGAIGGLVFSTASASGELFDLSQKTGISTTRLQELLPL